MRVTSIESRLIGVDSSPSFTGRAEPPTEAELRPWQYLVTSVSTDEGIEGYSMMWGLNQEARGIGHLLHDVFADLVIGTDPTAVEARWQQLRDKTRGTYPLSDSIVCLLDVAFWDILGKATGRPIVELLGRYRDVVPAYASPSGYLSMTVEGTYDEALAVKSHGFHGYKLWCTAGPHEDLPRIRAAREAVGAQFPLMADAGGKYRFTEAMEVGLVLDDLHYRWYEEPISDYHIPLLARLAAELRTPILAGEKTTPVGYLPEYVRQGAVDIVRGDVLMKAGITGMRKLAILSELHGYDLEIHGTLTPLLDIANLHVSGAIRNSEYAEVFWEPYYRFGLKGDPLVPGPDGMLAVPTAPGLGVELDWDWLDDRTLEVIPPNP